MLKKRTDFFEKYILLLPNCIDERPCPFHEYWVKMQEDLKDMFTEARLDELGRKIKNEELPLLATKNLEPEIS